MIRTQSAVWRSRSSRGRRAARVGPDAADSDRPRDALLVSRAPAGRSDDRAGADHGRPARGAPLADPRGQTGLRCFGRQHILVSPAILPAWGLQAVTHTA